MSPRCPGRSCVGRDLDTWWALREEGIAAIADELYGWQQEQPDFDPSMWWTREECATAVEVVMRYQVKELLTTC